MLGIDHQNCKLGLPLAIPGADLDTVVDVIFPPDDSNTALMMLDAMGSDHNNEPIYTIDVTLERRNCVYTNQKGQEFLVKWKDCGTHSWVRREDILDKELINHFEEHYLGFQQGATVLRVRRRRGKMECLIAWLGRPEEENTWVLARDLHPDLAEKLGFNAGTKRKRRRRREYSRI
ncbi:hypothetical protein BX600DRAFT_438351 [Xylariales sp. PMI_506]|nr:hypothetical protein BX600DRAFT_438351 [Xylariales sp. PMI_506]